jgi:hypothetical protein
MNSGKSKLDKSSQKIFSREEKEELFLKEINSLENEKVIMISIEEEDGRLELSTPYNADYVKEVKKLQGAKYNPNSRSWSVNSSEREKANELVEKIFGEKTRESYTKKTFDTKENLQIRISSYEKKYDEYTIRMRDNSGRSYTTIKADKVINYIKKNNVKLENY